MPHAQDNERMLQWLAEETQQRRLGWHISPASSSQLGRPAMTGPQGDQQAPLPWQETTQPAQCPALWLPPCHHAGQRSPCPGRAPPAPNMLAASPHCHRGQQALPHPLCWPAIRTGCPSP